MDHWWHLVGVQISFVVINLIISDKKNHKKSDIRVPINTWFFPMSQYLKVCEDANVPIETICYWCLFESCNKYLHRQIFKCVGWNCFGHLIVCVSYSTRWDCLYIFGDLFEQWSTMDLWIQGKLWLLFYQMGLICTILLQGIVELQNQRRFNGMRMGMSEQQDIIKIVMAKENLHCCQNQEKMRGCHSFNKNLSPWWCRLRSCASINCRKQID